MKRIFRLVHLVAACGLLVFTSGNLAAAQPSSKSTNKTSTSSKAKVDRVDLNSADQAELEALPGVGPETARAIIAARPFKSVGELETVKGIGPEKMRELRPLVSARTQVKMDGKGSARSMEKKSDRAVTKSQRPDTTSDRPVSKSDDSDSRKSDRGQAKSKSFDKSDGAGAPTGRMDNNSERRSPTAAVNANGPKVNLNTATKEELEALPEIGPVKAQSIIDARPFKTPEDVMRVSGIKEATFEAIRDRIIVK